MAFKKAETIKKEMADMAFKKAEAIKKEMADLAKDGKVREAEAALGETMEIGDGVKGRFDGSETVNARIDGEARSWKVHKITDKEGNVYRINGAFMLDKLLADVRPGIGIGVVRNPDEVTGIDDNGDERRKGQYQVWTVKG